MARESLASGLVDEITVLVTIDAIQKGYLRSGKRMAAQFLVGEGIFGQRTRWCAFRDAPAPDGRRLRRHVNFYQLDSPYLHGDRMPYAKENHEVRIDDGKAVGHGNLDNFLVEMVVEEIRRADWLARDAHAAPSQSVPSSSTPGAAQEERLPGVGEPSP